MNNAKLWGLKLTVTTNYKKKKLKKDKALFVN